MTNCELTAWTWECVKDLTGQQQTLKYIHPLDRSFFTALGIQTALHYFVKDEDRKQTEAKLYVQIPKRFRVPKIIRL